jgi:hypothetical protein
MTYCDLRQISIQSQIHSALNFSGLSLRMSVVTIKAILLVTSTLLNTKHFGIRLLCNIGIPSRARKPVSAAVAREVKVDDGETEGTSCDHDRVVHIRSTRIRRSGEHHNDDYERHPEDGNGCNREALSRDGVRKAQRILQHTRLTKRPSENGPGLKS